MSDDPIADIERRVVPLVAKQGGVGVEAITRATHFGDDLNFDSLDFTELTMALEEEFEISVPDAEAQPLETVEAVVGYVAERVKAASRS
jgi:acyl carrier protein